MVTVSIDQVTSEVDELLSPFPDVLIPSEIADLMRVDVKTVGRWDIPGTFRTLGGHRRYPKDSVRTQLIERRMRYDGQTVDRSVSKK
jgi:hypothetical protein